MVQSEHLFSAGPDHLPVILGRFTYFSFSCLFCKMGTIKNLPCRFVVRTQLGEAGRIFVTAHNTHQAGYGCLVFLSKVTVTSFHRLSVLNLIFMFLSLKSFMPQRADYSILPPLGTDEPCTPLLYHVHGEEPGRSPRSLKGHTAPSELVLLPALSTVLAADSRAL